MDSKKNVKVDIHRKSRMFLMLGLVLSTGIALIAFEWKSDGLNELGEYYDPFKDFDIVDEVPPTIIEPPKPPVIELPKIIEIPDEEEINDIVAVRIDTDWGDDTIIEDFAIPEELTDEPPVETEFIFLEEEASFPGGNKAWGKFLNKNLKYPRQAKRMGIEGRVFLQFDVSASGEISNIEIIRDIGGGCGEEAIRVLKASPYWNPGKQRGVAVKSKHRMNFLFKLK